MSYILEALKKSDQQRQRGTTPTLQAVQITVPAPKRPLYMHYGLFAAALLGTGIMIGWLQPWQPEQPAPETEPLAAKPPTLIAQQAAPAPLPEPEMAANKAQELRALNPAPAQPASGMDAMKRDIPATAGTGAPGAASSMPERPVPATIQGSAYAAQEPAVVTFAELPLQIQQEIPAMAIQLHAYSNIPGERLVNINSRSLREGGDVTPDLRLEQITPDGMIFNYKGYRFQRGIR